MRSVDEVRGRKVEQVASMIRRPSMWAHDGRSMQYAVQGAVSDLFFLDELDTASESFRDRLHFYGKLGVVGAFEAVFDEDCTYVAEVASVMAHAARVFDYFEVERRLTGPEWSDLVATIRDRYEEVDVRRSTIIDRVGEPSLTVDHRVLCYAGPSPEDWVAFDCWEPRARRYIIGEGDESSGFKFEGEDDPLLRDVRIPATSFDEGLVLTTYGKVLRWGPGWWIHTTPYRSTGSPEGIRAQLQAIDDADPSQSLGPRRR